MKLYAMAFVMMLSAYGALAAQVRIDETRSASPRGEIEIENAFGSVDVIGWEKNEVSVSGLLAGGAEGIEFEVEEGEVRIEVEIPDSWYYGSDGPDTNDSEFQSNLEIHVPVGSSVSIETLNGPITVRNVNGEAIEIETVNGSVSVQGAPQFIEIETLTGSVEVEAQAAEMEVESISGNVTIRGAARSVEAATVSGSVSVAGSNFEEAELASTSGNVTFEGSLATEGELEIETFSGSVRLVLPASTKAHFEMVTFSGRIESALGPKTTKKERFDPHEELQFSTGRNDFDVSITTYSGNITLSTSD